ncbi:hypothetical protein [Candidatus Gromoviella agglomerans]|uniref:hypothetical protein n=1 Tax=Candidatus Gromoviella agglomerans TaxID=2806609 RepID=UPI001E3C203B|nr:hypothetical protein [Candidatus Gromoviella agglomerans]
MIFAWKSKTDFTSSFKKTRGRPRIRQKLNHNKGDFLRHSKCGLCPHIYDLFLLKYINQEQLEAARAYFKISHQAITCLTPISSCILGRISNSRGYRVKDIPIKHDRIIKKYYRIRAIFGMIDRNIDTIIEKSVVKNQPINIDVRFDVMRRELYYLKKGLDIIHNYLAKDFHDRNTLQ